jgi:hypothetical protein
MELLADPDHIGPLIVTVVGGATGGDGNDSPVSNALTVTCLRVVVIIRGRWRGILF